MSYSIANLKNDVAARLHGTTVNAIQNFYGLCNAAASDILLRIDPQETKRLVETPPVFNGVWDYAVPTDLKGNRIIDIRPQFRRYPNDIWIQDYNQEFDLTKSGFLESSWQPTFTIEFNNFNKYIRLNSPNLIPGITVNLAESITDNGTWTVGGDASNLAVDNQNYIGGAGSLSFDLSGATGQGWLENSTMDTVNLSNQINQATGFLYTFLPTAADFNSVEYRWGSSSTDYYSVTVTTTQENTEFQNAWNLLAFEWLGASVTGSPDPSNITYIRVTWNYDVGQAQTAVHLNDITSALGTVLEMEYYSKFMFRDATTGAFKEKATSDLDLINLDTEAYMIYTNRFLFLAAQQKGGRDGSSDVNYFNQEYEKGIARYTGLYKSEVQKPRNAYYVQPNSAYGQYLGWGRWN